MPRSGGDFDKFTFEIEFRRLSTDEWRKMLDKIAVGKMELADVAREISAGWSGVDGEPGEPMPFSDSAFNELLNIAQVPAAIFAAFSKSLNGAAREKN